MRDWWGNRPTPVKDWVSGITTPVGEWGSDQLNKIPGMKTFRGYLD